ncbi:hypothetical protein MTO96_012911 [Rhipicephalus appendiculatus]
MGCKDVTDRDDWTTATRGLLSQQLIRFEETETQPQQNSAGTIYGNLIHIQAIFPARKLAESSWSRHLQIVTAARDIGIVGAEITSLTTDRTSALLGTLHKAKTEVRRHKPFAQDPGPETGGVLLGEEDGPPSSGGPGRGGRRGGRTSQQGTPGSSTQSTGSFDDFPSGPCCAEGDNRKDESVPGDDSSKNYFRDRSTFPVGADRPSRSKAVSFPTFADITAAMTLRREEIEPASQNSVSLHVYDCYLQAVSSDVRATLGSFRLVPDRGLGRVVTTANCDPVTLCGATVAFCDPEKQYVCYGQILKFDGKLVALLFDGLGITDDEESHEFVLVDLNLPTNRFINHLASLRSKSFDDMKRVKSLLQGEACESLESRLQVTHDEAAIKTAFYSSLNSNLAETHPFDENQVIAVKAAVTSQRGVLIHAPSGTGDKELLRAAVEATLTVDSLKNTGPVLVVGNGITPMFKNKPAGLFSLDTEVRKAADAVQESASAILSKGKMNEGLLRINKVLKDLITLKSTVLHQSRFHGITREFSTKRSEETNCIEKWLMQGVSRRDMLAVVSAADIDAYHEDCQYLLDGSCVSTKSNRSVGFRYERAPRTSQGAEGYFPGDLKAAYIWKTLKSTGSDLAAALSRARCAVYGFGRLASADESCQNVFNTAHENNRRAKPALTLSCVRHPGTIVRIESGDDFVTKLPQTGWCMEPCGAKRHCGHTCPEICHEGDHPGSCDRPCPKNICSRNHPCLNKCSERCTERCLVVVTEKLPYCTHTATLPCYKWEQRYVPIATLPGEAPSSRSGVLKYKCKIPVTVNLICGHTAQVPCFENQASKGTDVSALGPIGALSLRQYKCTVPVTVNLQCGHTTQIPCFEEKSTASTGASVFEPPGVLGQHKCTVPVTVVRDCGHQVQIACFENQLRTTTDASEFVRSRERVIFPQVPGICASDPSMRSYKDLYRAATKLDIGATPRYWPCVLAVTLVTSLVERTVGYSHHALCKSVLL